MPNKTIYVSDDDLPLYKKAQELAGNLSSAISIALRKYVGLNESSASSSTWMLLNRNGGQRFIAATPAIAAIDRYRGPFGHRADRVEL